MIVVEEQGPIKSLASFRIMSIFTGIIKRKNLLWLITYCREKGIIFGALDERSIAWKTALRCHEEGAQIVLNNAPVAMRMGEINKLAEAVNAPVIGADATSMEDLKKLFGVP